LTQQITGVSVSGEMLSLVNTINDMIAQLAIFAKEVKKVAFEVGTEGKLGVQAEVGNVQGIWQEITCVDDCLVIHFINTNRLFSCNVECLSTLWLVT